MQLNLLQLRDAACSATPNAEKFLAPFNETLAKYAINTPLRIAHFLAQVGHESVGLAAVREFDSGAAYEGRKDLGNCQEGDGVRFKGRGLIQITGRSNYAALGKAFGIDLLLTPSLLEAPKYAALSAGWYWSTRNLNALADKDSGHWNPADKEVFTRITRIVNGGINGIADREARYKSARRALGIPI